MRLFRPTEHPATGGPHVLQAWGPPLLAGLVVAIMAWPAATDWCQYDRAAILDGQLWRLATWYLTHWNWNHLIWDVAVFLILAEACRRRSLERLGALAVSGAAISLAVLAWQPGFAQCRGLSGLDSALFGLLAADLLARGRSADRLLGVLAVAGFLAKTAAELATGQALFAASEALFAPMPLAHLIGFLSGVAAVGAGLSRGSPRPAAGGRRQLATLA